MAHHARRVFLPGGCAAMTTANLAAADRRFGSELLAQLLALYDVRRAAIYARGREKCDETVRRPVWRRTARGKAPRPRASRRGLNHLRADAIAQRDRIRKRKAAREPQQNGARVRVPRADGIRHALDRLTRHGEQRAVPRPKPARRACPAWR